MRTFLKSTMSLSLFPLFFLMPTLLFSQDSDIKPKSLAKELQLFYSEIKKSADGPGKKGGKGKPNQEDLVKRALKVRDYFRGLDEKEVIPKLKESIQRTPFRSLFERYPILYKFLKEEFRHETALPQLFKLASKKRAFVIYGIFFLFTVLLGFYLKKKAEDEEGGIGAWFRRATLLFVMRFGAFVFIFGKELFPTLEVIFKLL